MHKRNENRNTLMSELREIRRLLSANGAGALNRELAANYLSVSPATLDRLTAGGKLRSVQVSQGRVAWRRADLDGYLESLVGA